MRQSDDAVIASALDIARETLGMQAAHFGTFTEDSQEIREVSGDVARFGLVPGLRVPNAETFCRRMIAGQIPPIVPDTDAEPGLAGIPAVAMIKSYVGVPVNASDGTTLGSFCLISAQADPSLEGRDLTFVRVLGQLVGDRVQRQELESQERERLESLVSERTQALERAEAETALRLSRAVEFRDDDTGGHIDRVGIMSERLARAAGSDAEFCRLMRLAAPLHDLGKVAAPDTILNKPGSLTDAERELIQEHPEIGHHMLADSSSEMLNLAASIARTHHERLDGGGYAQRLRDEEIPLEGRIVAIADVFDALTHDRAYRKALRVEDAVAIMRADVGHFDCELLELFITTVLPDLPSARPG